MHLGWITHANLESSRLLHITRPSPESPNLRLPSPSVDSTTKTLTARLLHLELLFFRPHVNAACNPPKTFRNPWAPCRQRPAGPQRGPPPARTQRHLHEEKVTAVTPEAPLAQAAWVPTPQVPTPVAVSARIPFNPERGTPPLRFSVLCWVPRDPHQIDASSFPPSFGGYHSPS